MKFAAERHVRMRAETLDDRQTQNEDGKTGASCVVPSLMTPARKAALDALEREFSDLLNGRRKVA